MAGWDVLMQPYIYHPPVAPEVPKADNTAAELISRGTQTAVGAFLRAAGMRQEAALETQRLAQEGALRMEGYDVQRRGQDLNYLESSNRLDLAKELQSHQIEHLDAMTGLEKARASLYTTNLSHDVERAESQAKFIEEAGKMAHELGLEDNTKFQTEHPMQYAKNALGFSRIYGSTTDKFLLARVKKYLDSANASKVKLDGKNYSWSQIAQDIERNKEESPFWDALQKNGYFDVATKTEGKQVITERTPKALVKRIMSDQMGGTPIKEIDAMRPKTDPFAEQRQTILNKKLNRYGTTAAGRLAENAPLPEPEVAQRDRDVDDFKRLVQAHPEKADDLKAQWAKLYPGEDPPE